MTTVLDSTSATPTATTYSKSHGLWPLAWRRLRANRVAMFSLAIVCAYLLMLVLSTTGLVAKHWDAEVFAACKYFRCHIGRSAFRLHSTSLGSARSRWHHHQVHRRLDIPPIGL